MNFSRSEKALLVGIEFPREPIPISVSLQELARLAMTAGAQITGSLTQKRTSPDPKYFIGSGKLVELRAKAAANQANLIVFDHELSPSQERNLENELGLKIIDRTELILDIFAQHARSREGKLQVELAQASYMLTRLSGHGVLMSRLGGGIGTRGPGETKLEYDRRRIRSRIARLKEEIEKVRKERSLKREKRRHSQITVAAIIGYTNAGKSTLLNSLTDAGVLTADKLFATLDPTTRRLYLPSGNTILLTDTVGFIQKLPHQLVSAFRATLEEVSEADLLVHVVDVSHPYYENQIASVYTVLEELHSITKPILTVLNKIDHADKKIIVKALKKYKPACAVSALSREGIDNLVATIDGLLPPPPFSTPTSI
jgi:GTP-binding protein HflX